MQGHWVYLLKQLKHITVIKFTTRVIYNPRTILFPCESQDEIWSIFNPSSRTCCTILILLNNMINQLDGVGSMSFSIPVYFFDKYGKACYSIILPKLGSSYLERERDFRFHLTVSSLSWRIQGCLGSYWSQIPRMIWFRACLENIYKQQYQSWIMDMLQYTRGKKNNKQVNLIQRRKTKL